MDGIDEAWAVTGPPALCVMFARLGAFGPPFDLVVSGINPGANVGRSVYHSGTVGAAYRPERRHQRVAVSQAVAGFGVEGQGWDEMLADQRGRPPPRPPPPSSARSWPRTAGSPSSSTSTSPTWPRPGAGWR